MLQVGQMVWVVPKGTRTEHHVQICQLVDDTVLVKWATTGRKDHVSKSEIVLEPLGKRRRASTACQVIKDKNQKKEASKSDRKNGTASSIRDKKSCDVNTMKALVLYSSEKHDNFEKAFRRNDWWIGVKDETYLTYRLWGTHGKNKLTGVYYEGWEEVEESQSLSNKIGQGKIHWQDSACWNYFFSPDPTRAYLTQKKANCVQPLEVCCTCFSEYKTLNMVSSSNGKGFYLPEKEFDDVIKEQVPKKEEKAHRPRLRLDHSENSDDWFLMHLYTGLALSATSTQLWNKSMKSVVRAAGIIVETDGGGHQHRIFDAYGTSIKGHCQRHAEMVMLKELEERCDNIREGELMHGSQLHLLVMIVHNMKSEQGSICKDCADALRDFLIKNNMSIEKTRVVYPASASKRDDSISVSPVTSIVHVERCLKSVQHETGVQFLKSKINGFQSVSVNDSSAKSYVGREVEKHLIQTD